MRPDGACTMALRELASVTARPFSMMVLTIYDGQDNPEGLTDV